MTTKKTGKKGLETEETVRSYFLAAGFFVLRGVKLRQAGDDLTDIDLWVYERSATLARRRMIVDIKDNMQPKAAERLFFVKGLAEIIQVEAAGIVTSDTRRSLRELAQRHNVIWIDNADLQRLKTSEKLARASRITDEDLNELITNIDKSRSSKHIKEQYEFVKSSVANRFGPAAANTAIEGANLFARMTVEAHPKSSSAELFTRLTYFCTAIAAAALDYASGDFALRPHQERLKNFTEAIRFGEDAAGTTEKLRWTTAAIRDFAPDGAGLAEIIQTRFNAALRAIPAEDLAEIAARMANGDRLFNAARDLESSAFAVKLPHFDMLSVDARNILGAVLDFLVVERVRFAAAISINKSIDEQKERDRKLNEEISLKETAASAKTLF